MARRLSWHDTVAEGVLPIGTASEGVEIVLLDEAGNPVGPGEVGEIAIRTSYLAAGYWQGAEPATGRFATATDERKGPYRTGDMGRFNADGLLLHLGREKFRASSFGAIGSICRKSRLNCCGCPSSTRQSSAPSSAPATDPRLVAYLILRSGHPASAGAIRSSLRAALPAPHGAVGFCVLRGISAHAPRQDQRPRTAAANLRRAKRSGGRRRAANRNRNPACRGVARHLRSERSRPERRLHGSQRQLADGRGDRRRHPRRPRGRDRYRDVLRASGAGGPGAGRRWAPGGRGRKASGAGAARGAHSNSRFRSARSSTGSGHNRKTRRQSTPGCIGCA